MILFLILRLFLILIKAFSIQFNIIISRRLSPAFLSFISYYNYIMSGCVFSIRIYKYRGNAKLLLEKMRKIRYNKGKRSLPKRRLHRIQVEANRPRFVCN